MQQIFFDLIVLILSQKNTKFSITKDVLWYGMQFASFEHKRLKKENCNYR